MNVKRFLQSQNLPHHMEAEQIDGRYVRFDIVPTSEITDKNLAILPYYRAIRKAADEPSEYMYQMWGVSKK